MHAGRPLGLRASPGLISCSQWDDPATLMLHLLGSTRRFFSDAATWNEETPSFGHLKKWGLSVAPRGFLQFVERLLNRRLDQKLLPQTKLLGWEMLGGIIIYGKTMGKLSIFP